MPMYLNDLLVIILAMIFGAAPILFCSIPTIRKWGIGFWLFSPLPAFLFAFLVAFGIVPLAEVILSVHIYEGLSWNSQTFQVTELLAVLSCWAFSIGYLVVRGSPREADTSLADTLEVTERSRNEARTSQNITFIFAILMQAIFTLFLISIHALTLNFGSNRTLYLASMFGAGYMTLVNDLGHALILIGLLLSIWTRRLGTLGYVALAVFLIPNIMITTRGGITSMLYLIIFNYFVNQYRKSGKIKPARLVAMLGLIVSLGAAIGLSRAIGGTDEPLPEDSTPTEVVLNSLPPPVRSIIFLSYSFDMEVTFQQTIANSKDLEWGESWFEDIFYTFLPRFLFPDKPILFGATRLQAKVAPDITNGDVLVTASYPIGIFGEAYVNFGVPGVFITLFLLGMMLKYMYDRCLQLIHDKKVNWMSLYFMVLYTTLCSNSLPYMRSLGQFLALLIFLGLLLLACLGLIQWIGRMNTRAVIVSSPA